MHLPRVTGFVLGAAAFCIGLQASRQRVVALEHEVQRLHHEVKHAGNARDKVLGTLTHELRTPLNAVLGWLQILRIANDNAVMRERALSVMERNARDVVRHLVTLEHDRA